MASWLSACAVLLHALLIVCVSFPFGVRDRMWNWILSIPDLCLSFTFHPLNPLLKNGPHQANLALITYASSKGSGETAHPRSLARTSAARSYKQCVKIPGSSEWLGMRS